MNAHEKMLHALDEMQAARDALAAMTPESGSAFAAAQSQMLAEMDNSIAGWRHAIQIGDDADHAAHPTG